MQNMLGYFVLLFLGAFAVAGLYIFFIVTTDYGKIFSFVQSILTYADQKANTKTGFAKLFWLIVFKSLGGCETCTRQRITELAFAGISCFWQFKFHHGVYFALPIYLKISLQIMSFIIFIGMVTTWAMLIKKNEVKTVKQETYFDQEI